LEAINERPILIDLAYKAQFWGNLYRHEENGVDNLGAMQNKIIRLASSSKQALDNEPARKQRMHGKIAAIVLFVNHLFCSLPVYH
jgi:hypothetical protein